MSVYELENEDRLAIARDRVLRDILRSNEPVERIAVKACAAGLVSYVSYEELTSYTRYERKSGGLAGAIFGTREREDTQRSVRRLVMQR